MRSFEDTQRTLAGPIPALDGLRGIAILLVAFAHFIGAYHISSRADAAVYETLRAGWCGVDLFFVLSGFLITGILVETKTASNYFQSFYMRRFLRIFPLYYACLALWFFGFGSVAESQGWTASAIGQDRQLWYWLYVSNWMVPEHEAVGALGHLWSLAVEEQFYLVWPLVVWLVSTRKLAWVCVAAVIIAPAFRCVLVANGMASDAAYEWTPARMDALACGALLALLLRSPAGHRFVARWWRHVFGVGLAALVAIAIVNGGLAFNLTVMKTIGYSLLACTAAAAIAGAILSRDGAFGRRCVESAFLRAWGKYSYAIYVIHYPLFALSSQKLIEAGQSWLQTRWGYALFVVGGLACSFGLAWLSWHLFEKHFLSLKQRFAARR